MKKKVLYHGTKEMFMDKVTLGNTGITVCRNGFGALPIQRISKEDAAYIVRLAYKGGVSFFDNKYFGNTFITRLPQVMIPT